MTKVPMGLTNMGLLRDKMIVGHYGIASTLHRGYGDECPCDAKGVRDMIQEDHVEGCG
jgi:hypothetical protein